MSKRRRRIGCIVSVVVFFLMILFLVGLPWRADKTWSADFDDVRLSVSQKFNRSVELYTVQLDVQDGENHYTFYISHQDYHWWTASFEQVSPGRFLIKKNGFADIYYNNDTKETIELIGYRNRVAMSINGSNVSTGYYTDEDLEIIRGEDGEPGIATPQSP